MRANPEPDEILTLAHAEGAIAEPDTGRIDRTSLMYLLEAETRVRGILRQELICSAGLPVHVSWQARQSFAEPRGGVRFHSASGSSGRVRLARCSLRASSARRSSASGVSFRRRSHSDSAATSARMAWASASCSAGESLAAAWKAFSRSLVIGDLYERRVILR